MMMSRIEVGASPLERLKRDLKSKARHRREEAALTSVPRCSTRNDLLPELQLVNRPLRDLVIPKRNVRRLEAGHIQEVALSIGELGFSSPVVIDGSNVVLDGAVRVEAAKLIGLESAPCIVVGHRKSVV